MAKTPQDLDETQEILLDLANMVIADLLFDPDREQDYKALVSRRKRAAAKPVVLDEYSAELPDGEVFVRVDAVKTGGTCLRVAFSGEGFESSIEGNWSLRDSQLLPDAEITYSGSAELIEAAADDLMDELDRKADEQDPFDAEDDVPLIGDDPAEPPPAGSMERNRVKSVAKRISKMKELNLGVEDRAWLEQTPQTLPVITEAYIAAAAATGKQRDEALIASLELMLSVQLECVRYRHDRGWDWATDMLEDYQQRVITVGEAQSIPQEDWFRMAVVLSEARVPVSEEMQHRLAEAGFRGDAPERQEDMVAELRGFLDELAKLAATPFEVMETMMNSAALMPAGLRGFLATELSLSPHAQLRDTVPLMLLDKESAVRRDAAGALEQNAAPDALSPDSLRRVIAVRNWIPPTDRSALDSAVRKARLAGVAIAPWPVPVADVEYYATLLDGSGAQSVLAVSRSGRKGLLSGLLLRHGDGVVDAWSSEDLSRAKITRMLKEAFGSAIFTRVDKAFADLVVQHAIATGTRTGTLPPHRLLMAAELLGGTEWQDRQVDVAEEADRLVLALPESDRSPVGMAVLHQTALDWMQDEAIAGSWYEDGPDVREALTGLPADDSAALLEAVMERVLPPRRADWAERFLLMALWCSASQDATYRSQAAGLAVVAQALTGDMPLVDIPVMRLIGLQTVQAAAEGGW